ncbi:MAG: hypothetical protein QN186_00005, partial [Armatimonadota bacterium]|nr:hypothetical protein [Armatimonadota bacterium]
MHVVLADPNTIFEVTLVAIPSVRVSGFRRCSYHHHHSQEGSERSQSPQLGSQDFVVTMEVFWATPLV